MTHSTHGSLALAPGASATPVLLVHDDPVQTRSMCLHLEWAGYRVHVATNARDAMALAYRIRPGLVLSGAAAPDPDGFDFCRSLRRDRLLRTTPVVLLSDHPGDAAGVRQAVRCGANMLVSLLKGPAAFLCAIKQALAHPSLWFDPADDLLAGTGQRA